MNVDDCMCAEKTRCGGFCHNVSTVRALELKFHDPAAHGVAFRTGHFSVGMNVMYTTVN